MKKTLVFMFTLIAMVSLVLVGCSSDAGGDDKSGGTDGGDSDAQDTLIYGRGADATRLDPATVTDGESLKVTQQVMETLIKFKPGTTELEPGLATDWSKKMMGKRMYSSCGKVSKFMTGQTLMPTLLCIILSVGKMAAMRITSPITRPCSVALVMKV